MVGIGLFRASIAREGVMRWQPTRNTANQTCLLGLRVIAQATRHPEPADNTKLLRIPIPLPLRESPGRHPSDRAFYRPNGSSAGLGFRLMPD